MQSTTPDDPYILEAAGRRWLKRRVQMSNGPEGAPPPVQQVLGNCWRQISLGRQPPQVFRNRIATAPMTDACAADPEKCNEKVNQ